MVSVPVFCPDDPSSNPAGYLINFLCEKTKINKKTPGLAHLFYKRTTWGGDLHLGSYLFHLETHRLEFLWLFMQENDAQLQ